MKQGLAELIKESTERWHEAACDYLKTDDPQAALVDAMVQVFPDLAGQESSTTSPTEME